MTTALRQTLRAARDERDRAQEAFVRAVIAAHDSVGYGTIAQWLELPKSTVQSMVNRYRKEQGQ